VKLGEVLMKERERKKLSKEDVASQLGISLEDYEQIEAGESEAEKWFPLLCLTAVKLSVPTSRLLAESGKSKDCKDGQAGGLIRGHRERRQLTAEQLAEQLEITKEEFDQVEAGQSGIEKWGPLFLHFAEIVELPVFNFYLPFGLPYTQLRIEDYH
jgi:transcriptional regulator with XRE-family HTH domain